MRLLGAGRGRRPATGDATTTGSAAGERGGPFRLEYNPSLDGLRALSVCGVVLGHAGLVQLAGYHGVTVFFVISGYLITSLLVQEFERNGRIGLPQFYRRRFARLAPALVVVVFASIVWLTATRVPLVTWWAGVVGSLTYTTDLIEAMKGNAHVSGSFQFTWSLGIEEQFYLLWPFVLVLLLRTRSAKMAIGVLMSLIGVVWIARALQDFRAPTHELQFYGPISHADSLLWGAVLAFVMIRFGRHPRITRIAMFIGPMGLLGLALMFYYGNGAPVVDVIDSAGFGQTAIAATFCLFWIVALPRNWFARILAWRPIAFIGKLSYSIYLWNLLTIAVFVANVGVKPAFTKWGVLFVAGLLLVSYISWRYVETPLRRRWATSHAQARLTFAGAPAGIGWSNRLTRAKTTMLVRIAERQAGRSD